MTVYEGKGGIRAVWTRRKEPFGHTIPFQDPTTKTLN